METRGGTVAPLPEVPMIEPEVVRQVRILAERGWGAKRIARVLGVARNTVRRYLRADRRPRCRPGPDAGASMPRPNDVMSESRSCFSSSFILARRVSL